MLNRLRSMFESYGMRRSTAIYEQGLRVIQVTLYHALSEKYALTLDLENAKILAAQVVNYLKGEDIEDITQIVQSHAIYKRFALWLSLYSGDAGS